MPAIQPDLLKRQTAQIAASFQSSEKFIRLLQEHLDWYSDRTRRRGLNSPPPPLLHTYRVPEQVMRELLHQLAPLAEEDPAAALQLADDLWRVENLECRRLAVHLLAWTPVDTPKPVEDRINRWARPGEETEILELLLTAGTARYRQEAPDRFLRLAKDWLTSTNSPTQALGLRLLTGLVNDTAFSNLPVIFMRIKNLIQTAPPELQPDLQEIIRALAGRSSKETAFFLHECLIGSQSPGTAYLVRKSMDLFPAETQIKLRETLAGPS
jgi:DNA alkylation repair enzyme